MAKGKYQEWLTPEGLLLIEGWARDGLTDEQIAYNMGIRRQTLYDWKKKYPDISDSLKSGKEVIDRKVENALLKRALGFEYDEVTQELNMDGELEVTKVVTKQVVPDTTAQIFWLKNRQPVKWTNKEASDITKANRELELKERELELKEKELAKKNAPPEKPNIDSYIEALKGRASEVWKDEE